MSKVCTILSYASNPQLNDNLTRVATLPGVFKPEECQALIAQCDQLPEADGGLGGDDHTKSQIRQSKVRYLMPEQFYWLYERFDTAVRQVNQGYGFELNGMEHIQLASYEVGGHYDWHLDLGEEENSTRKLSLSVQLSDPSSYEGGELEFHKQLKPCSKQMGDLIAFPSYKLHRVCPVTQGRRYSLVAWCHGPTFR